MAVPHNIEIAQAKHFTRRLGLLFLLLTIFTPLYADPPGLSQHLVVELHPNDSKIHIDNTITVAETVSRFEFVLNAGLSPSSPDGTLKILRDASDGSRRAYRVTLDRPGNRLRLSYSGVPRFAKRQGMGGMPEGDISDDGVYLDGSSGWYPLFDRPIDRLRLEVKVPEGWQSISIGKRSDVDEWQHWSTDVPHDDIYLIAGPYTPHVHWHHDIETSVWLLDDDPALAQRYLDLIGDYIDHYSEMIGGYPYAKFAVVENRWQTGYGMPSFTLLGSRVLRLPFIPYTSLPHEILHNWWGNGVWVDFRDGNWSEGLTAYLADHWMQERRNRGARYRLKALQRYSNFAADGNDMPLREFVSRHSDASQSIGYSKSLMLFHMLRNHMGDADFIAGLQRLWQTHRFTAIGFKQALQTLTAQNPKLLALSDQWLNREGAPRLALSDTTVERDAEGYRLTLTLTQEQRQPFNLGVPIAVTLDGEPFARQLSTPIDRKRHTVEFRFPQRPLRVDIDPNYDVLRILDPTEQPPALNRLFGGETVVVLPEAAKRAERKAWQALVEAWQRRYPGLRIVSDDTPLAPLANHLILGWDNRRLDETAVRVARQDQTLSDNRVRIGQRTFDAGDANVVLINTAADGRTTGFIGATGANAIAQLARKLPHYGSYGRLVFDSDGNNRLKEALSSTHSRLTRQLGETNVELVLPPVAVLGEKTHVRQSGEDVGSSR